MVDLIIKKRDGFELTDEEIKFWIDGYVKGEIPDYQSSAMTMAIFFKGMNKREIATLTDCMEHSGEVIDLSAIEGIKVDKHSTGGVGDKTSLVLGPMVAAVGGKLAKMSGRGLGHTGGTLDKLESIPGLTIDLSEDRFLKQVKKINLAIAGQTQNLVPADKMLYALRDVTGTVKSIPLIASSIMSKKLASGADVICLDVKYGSGAFMKTIDEAKDLSNEMIKIAKAYGKDAVCFISDMDSPLGLTIGNRLEVVEAVNCLKNKGPKDLEELCVYIAGYMAYKTSKVKTIKEGIDLACSKLRSFEAYNKFLEFIDAQGATTHDFDNLVQVKKIVPVLSNNEGYIKKIDALTLGVEAMRLGAGRVKKEDSIDPNVGIVLNKKVSDYVKKGDKLLDLYVDDLWDDSMIETVLNAYEYSKEKVELPKAISEIIE